MPLNVVLDEGRGIRATASMSLKDGTPSPPYVVEWVSALQTDLLIVGTVKVDDKVRQRVDVMKKGFRRSRQPLPPAAAGSSTPAPTGQAGPKI